MLLSSITINERDEMGKITDEVNPLSRCAHCKMKEADMIGICTHAKCPSKRMTADIDDDSNSSTFQLWFLKTQPLYGVIEKS
jgi:hypothetical protein